MQLRDEFQIMWSPAGPTMQSVGARALIDITDGDTPNIRMPIRMLSVDTPAVTARTEQRARAPARCTAPEDYADIPPPYRLWIWHDDVVEVVGRR